MVVESVRTAVSSHHLVYLGATSLLRTTAFVGQDRRRHREGSGAHLKVHQFSVRAGTVRVQISMASKQQRDHSERHVKFLHYQRTQEVAHRELSDDCWETWDTANHPRETQHLRPSPHQSLELYHTVLALVLVLAFAVVAVAAAVAAHVEWQILPAVGVARGIEDLGCSFVAARGPSSSKPNPG